MKLNQTISVSSGSNLTAKYGVVQFQNKSYGNQNSITTTSVKDQTFQFDLKVLIRSVIEVKDLNRFFENAEAYAKIKMAEFLRYSHEQFIVYYI